jgi:hypothetical protein
MRSLAICCILFILLMAPGSASLAMYEAGKAVVCIDDKFEKGEVFLDTYPTLYFEPVTSREQVSSNEYTLIINKIGIMGSSDFSIIYKPIQVMISDSPFDLAAIFMFTPIPVKTVSVGKLGQINTTLYTGSWSNQTPHLVTFTEGNISCCIYDQDTTQSEMEDFLKRIDVLSKVDLPTLLPLLWTE